MDEQHEIMKKLGGTEGIKKKAIELNEQYKIADTVKNMVSKK